jgi:hypothetical protein
MNDIGVLSCFVRASRRAAGVVESLCQPRTHPLWQAAIHLATLSGCLFAFAWPWTFSASAHAAPATDHTPQRVLAPLDSRHTAGSATLGVPTNREQRVHDVALQDSDVSYAASASASNDNRLPVFDGSGNHEPGAATARQRGLWALSIAVVAALIGMCLLLAALRRATGKSQAIANERASRCQSTEAADRTGITDHSPPTHSTDSEPFEQGYLDALSGEGIDLAAFLIGWRDAMNEALHALASALHCPRDPAHVGGLLHRLSGAVGLVGARALMEALRRTSVSPLEHDIGSIHTLIDRARNLVEQLDTAPGGGPGTHP